jgi:1-deoxy-D-xylulose-5-phosphate synthase
MRRDGRDTALIVFGAPLAAAMRVAETLDLSVADMRFVKPLDLDLLRQLAENHTRLVTIEENAVMGGAGSAVAEALAGMGITLPLLRLGLPDRFVEHGDPNVLLTRCGLDADGIEQAIRAWKTS